MTASNNRAALQDDLLIEDLTLDLDRAEAGICMRLGFLGGAEPTWADTTAGFGATAA